MKDYDWETIRRIYLALYTMDLIKAGFDENQIISVILWDEKTRPDMIITITKRSYAMECCVREDCVNRAIEIYRENRIGTN